MVKNFGYILTTAGVLMFGVGVVNTPLTNSAKAEEYHTAEPERATPGRTEEAERPGSKEERERGGTYEMGERGGIREEGREREQKADKEKRKQMEKMEKERKEGRYGY
jgi:hypothetical protein